jgi:hypothetical protein
MSRRGTCAALGLVLSAAALAAPAGIARAAEAPRTSPPAAAASPGDGEAFHLAPLSAYSEVTARPLFSPDRRPHAPQAMVSAGAHIALRGIVVDASARYALIEEGAPPARRVGEGQALAIGTVERIAPDHIVLRAQDGSRTIVKLFVPGAHGPAPGAGAAGNSKTKAPPQPRARLQLPTRAQEQAIQAAAQPPANTTPDRSARPVIGRTAASRGQ